MRLTQIIEESYMEEIGIETSPGDKSFLKGALMAGGLAALLGDPESAEATKEALSGAADNVGDFFHNTFGHGEHAGGGYMGGGYTGGGGGAGNGNNLSAILANQGYFKDQETGAWINPNDHKVYFNQNGPMSSDELSNKINDATLKANHYGLYSISPGLAGGVNFAGNHPLLATAAVGGAGYGTYKGVKSLKNIFSKNK